MPRRPPHNKTPDDTQAGKKKRRSKRSPDSAVSTRAMGEPTPPAAAPTPHKRGPLPEPLHEQAQTLFLDSFARLGNITKACEVANIDRSTFRYWRDTDSVFAKRFTDADEAAIDVLYGEAVRRGTEGVERYVVSMGKIVYVKDDAGNDVPLREREYSDALLRDLLRARDPRFKDKRQLEVTGKDGGPVATSASSTVSLDLATLTDEQLAALKTALAADG